MSKSTTTRKSAATTRSGKSIKATGKAKRSRAKASSAGATKPKATASPKANGSTPAADVKVTLKQVAEYAKANASTDQDAPAQGHVFVQNGRVYLRLEGLAKSLGIESPGKLRGAIVDGLGFARKPFSYTNSKGEQTSASYFSREIDGMGLGKTTNRQARKASSKGGNGSPQKRGGKQS